MADKPTTVDNPTLAHLWQQRDQQMELADAALRQAHDDSNRDLSDAERRLVTDVQSRVAAIDVQIELINSLEQRRAAGESAAATYRPAGRPAAGGQERTGAAYTEPRAHEYESAGHVIVDQIRAAGWNGNGQQVQPDSAARDRLHGAGVRAPGEARALVNETTADVPGLLPKPIIGNVVNNIDARRPFISSIGSRDLGGIPGKTFTRPVVTQHVAVGQQLAEKTELVSQQMKVGGVDFTKNTFGGALDVARQVIDWTSPAAWNALLEDLQAVYAKVTENRAADDFAAAVTQTVPAGEIPADPAAAFLAITRALYAAGALSYGQVEELPNHIWMSLDMWATIGPLMDMWRRQTASNNSGPDAGNSSPTNFAGNIVDFDRTVVPSFPTGTVIVGVRQLTEVYEDRIGLLTAVEPKLLGVEIAYGGYMANGTLKPNAFAKVTFTAPANG